jgi:hypothetical protein
MIERVCGHSDPRSCDLACRVEAIEAFLQPRGRCAVCGGGESYWKHYDNEDWHAFVPATSRFVGVDEFEAGAARQTAGKGDEAP